MRIRKSQEKPHILKQKHNNQESEEQFQQQQDKVKIIYPKKRKIKQKEEEKKYKQKNVHKQTTHTLKEKQMPEKLYQFHDRQKSEKLLTKKSFHKLRSNNSRQQQNLKESKVSSYKPRVLESYAIQKTNPQNQNHLHNSRQLRNNRVLSQKQILQQSNYTILQSQVHSQRSGSSLNKKNTRLNQVINQVGIKNQNKSKTKNDNYINQYTQLSGINQFIRRKKQSGTSSLFGRAMTQPVDNLKTIKQIEDEAFQSNYFKDRKKFITRSQVTQSKIDMFIPLNNKFLPNIDGNRSMSRLMGGKIRTEANSPSGLEFRNINDQINKQLLQKLLKKRKKSSSSRLQNKQKDKPKQPSLKRVRQDFKYVVQKDDSQRYHQRVKPLLNEQNKKIKFLKDKQQMLGKIVLQRVQKHLKHETKQKGNYITKVKSQKSIDQALIQFLKMKVNRADKVLSKKDR